MYQHTPSRVATSNSARLGPARPSSARPTGSSSASPLENCPPYFYHITSFLSHLPLPGLVATTITVNSFSLIRLSRLDGIFSDACPPFLSPFLSCPSPRSPSLIRILPSFPLPFHRYSLSSFLLPRRHRSFRGAASPQRRDLAHRHFTCVSFARRYPVLLFCYSFLSFPLPSPLPPPPLALLPSRRTLTPSDSLPSLSFSLSFLSTKIAHLHPYSRLMPATPYQLAPDNDCYRLMRVCILARIHASTRGGLEANTIGDAISWNPGEEECPRSRATARCEMHFLRQYLERF